VVYFVSPNYLVHSNFCHKRLCTYSIVDGVLKAVQVACKSHCIMAHSISVSDCWIAPQQQILLQFRACDAIEKVAVLSP
jgi:hypothetical protein